MVYDILSNLPEDQYAITLVTAPGGDLLTWIDKLNLARTNKIRKITPSCIRRSISPINDLIAFFRLLILMWHTRFEVAHFHNSKVGILGRLAAWLTHIPKIYYTVHGWGLNHNTASHLYKILSSLERIVAKLSTAVIFVSQSDMERGLQNKWALENNASLIYNGIKNEIVTQKKMPEIPGDGPVIIFVARLAEPKEPLLALKASEFLQRKGYSHKMLIVGDGPQYSACAQYISVHQLQSHITLLGKRDDVRELLGCSDIFCLFSRWEGLPVSILEAMSLGLPVVASAVGGTPELVKHGLTGYLVENFEVETISSYLKILLCDDDLRQRMGNTARIVVREHFGLNEMVERYRRLYEAPYSTITGGYHE